MAENDGSATLPEDSAPNPSAGDENVDWQQRYKDTQAEYTQNQQALAEERKVWEDEQELLRRVEEKFPHLLADEEEEEEDDYYEEEPEGGDEVERPLTRAEFEEFRRQQDMADRARQFHDDLEDAVGDRELSDYGRDAIVARAQRGDIKNADDLQKAVDGWFEHVAASKPKPRPKAPHVPGGGQPASQVVDFSKMTQDEIDEWMVERVRAGESQS